MIENTALPPASTPVEADSAGPVPAMAKARRPAGRWAFPIGALAAGLILGGATGASVVLASSDPTQSEEYRGLQARADELEGEVQDVEGRLRRAEGRATSAEAGASQAVAAAQSRQRELDQREQAVLAREQAVTAVEQTIKANSIGQGIWTVGVDLEPGTYRASQPVSSDCYWAITRSGSNGSDIIDNDIPGGGMPTVTLQAGQDFVNNRCGTFVKQ